MPFKKICLFLSLFLVSQLGLAKGIGFDLLDSTPVGSWQEREETTVNHKGRTTVSVMRTSLLGKETRNGEDYVWMEVAMEGYKVKKNGKRKKDGERTVLKALIPESVFKNDPSNVLTNVRGFGEEIIVQSGKEKPMRLSGAGGLFDGMMKAMGTEVNYAYEAVGSESVTVPAGEFSAQKMQGSGSTESKVVFKTIKVESETTAWLSQKVPFGIVKAQGSSTINGKRSTHTTQLLSFGASGAKSEIVGEPQDMPNLGDIFGN